MSILLALQSAPPAPTRAPMLLWAASGEDVLDEMHVHLLWRPQVETRRFLWMQGLSPDEPSDDGWPQVIGGRRDVPVIVGVTRRRMPPLIRSKVRRGPKC